jgi:hypothetical protein
MLWYNWFLCHFLLAWYVPNSALWLFSISSILTVIVKWLPDVKLAAELGPTSLQASYFIEEHVYSLVILGLSCVLGFSLQYIHIYFYSLNVAEKMDRNQFSLPVPIVTSYCQLESYPRWFLLKKLWTIVHSMVPMAPFLVFCIVLEKGISGMISTTVVIFIIGTLALTIAFYSTFLMDHYFFISQTRCDLMKFIPFVKRKYIYLHVWLVAWAYFGIFQFLLDVSNFDSNESVKHVHTSAMIACIIAAVVFFIGCGCMWCYYHRPYFRNRSSLVELEGLSYTESTKSTLEFPRNRSLEDLSGTAFRTENPHFHYVSHYPVMVETSSLSYPFYHQGSSKPHMERDSSVQQWPSTRSATYLDASYSHSWDVRSSSGFEPSLESSDNSALWGGGDGVFSSAPSTVLYNDPIKPHESTTAHHRQNIMTIRDMHSFMQSGLLSPVSSSTSTTGRLVPDHTSTSSSGAHGLFVSRKSLTSIT